MSNPNSIRMEIDVELANQVPNKAHFIVGEFRSVLERAMKMGAFGAETKGTYVIEMEHFDSEIEGKSK